MRADRCTTQRELIAIATKKYMQAVIIFETA